MTLLLALIGAAVQRWTSCNAHEAAFMNAMRITPKPLAEMAQGDLGVYPVADQQRYRGRPEDESIRDALAAGESKCLVITGGPGVGKSRSAYETVCAHFLNSKVFVPLDPDGLRWLIDNETDSPDDSATVLLWLDGIDRLIDGLDPSSVQSLANAKDPAVQIVATVRTELWTNLLGGTGQQSQTARALEGVSKVVSLKTSWVDLPEDASSEGDPPSRPAVANQTLDAEAGSSGLGSIWRDRWLRGAGFAVALVVLGGVVIGLRSQGRALVQPPPIADQIAGTLTRLLRGGRHIVVNERVRLHSTEDDSWVVVTEDAANGAAFYSAAVGDNGSKPPQSDELRIYDVRGGWLRLMLDFRPKASFKEARAWATPAGAPTALDYNDDGTQEIIAGYQAPDAHGDTLPFVITWQNGSYELVAMTPHPPELGTLGFTAAVLKDRTALYLKRTKLVNAVRDSRVNQLVGYPVQAFALSQTPTVRLLTGYYAALPGGGRGGDSILELRANQVEHSTLTLRACAPTTPSCPSPPFEQDAVVPPAKTLNNGLLAAWNLRGKRWSTPVALIAQTRKACRVVRPAPTTTADPSDCGASPPSG